MKNSPPNKKGIVYILTNQSFGVNMPLDDTIIKIGKTEDLDRRVKQLSGTALPYPFEVFFAAEVANADWMETCMHILFDQFRLNNRREFFKMNPFLAKNAFVFAGNWREVSLYDPNYIDWENLDKDDF